MRRSLLLLLSMTFLGCGAGQVQVVSRGIFTEKPGNVAAYVAVSEHNKALTGLTADNFRIYEDEQLIPPDNSRQVLLDKELANAHRAVLLIDQSAATDEKIRTELANALSFFVGRVRKTQAISIYAFDGRKELRLVADLEKQAEPVDLKKQFFDSLVPADTSRNLNGAVALGLKKLDETYHHGRAPMRAGTLVVFAAGPDLAGRVDEDSVRRQIQESEYSIITVGLGDTAPALKDFGRDGFVDGFSVDTVSMAFEEAGYLVEDEYQRHYLLAYCSPARAAERSLRIEVAKLPEQEHADGSSEELGPFSARGFSEGCDPNKKPNFKTAK